MMDRSDALWILWMYVFIWLYAMLVLDIFTGFGWLLVDALFPY
jgi:hypothetical protein